MFLQCIEVLCTLTHYNNLKFSRLFAALPATKNNFVFKCKFAFKIQTLKMFKH